MTTIRDVAERARVSPSTVSRVMSDSPRISEETKERVRSAIRDLNYHPNVVAQGLVKRTSGSIAIIHSGISEFFENAFFSEVLGGIDSVLRHEDSDLLLSAASNDEIATLERVIRSGRAAGVILLRSRVSDPLIERVHQLKVPAVLLGRPMDGAAHVSYVDNDNVQAAYEATAHLLKLGHREIGFLGGSDELVVTVDRMKGYRNALMDFGLQVDARLCVPSFFLERGGYLGMMRLLALSTRPTAIVASDDILAIGAMRAAVELGYRIPDDIAIVGFNNIGLTDLVNPPLSTIDVQMSELGREAAAMLLRQIRTPSGGSEHAILPHRLVIRKSCGAKLENSLAEE
jgi:DNA-binding LacI/PurR family transcriptional regulator